MTTENSSLSRRKFVSTLAAGAGLTLTAGATGTTAQAAAASSGEVIVDNTQNVFSDGRWNGRPTLKYFKDHYYLFFHTGTEHASDDGRIRVLRSRPKEPAGWEPIAVLDSYEHNDAEVHVLATADRLFAYLVLEAPVDVGGYPLGTMVSHSSDGTTWSQSAPVYAEKFSGWKPVSHKGMHYMAVDTKTDKGWVELVSSIDGLRWNKVSDIIKGNVTETSLVFLEDESLLAVTRQGWVSIAKPPYTEWRNEKTAYCAGPAVGIVGGTIVASGRVSAERYPDDQPGGSRTGLFTVNRSTLQLQWQKNLFSQWGKDVSYPDILSIGENRALIAWYDGEGYEKGQARQADIYLATLRVV